MFSIFDDIRQIYKKVAILPIFWIVAVCLLIIWSKKTIFSNF